MSHEETVPVYRRTAYSYKKEIYGADDPCVFYHYWTGPEEPDEYYLLEHTATDKRRERRSKRTKSGYKINQEENCKCLSSFEVGQGTPQQQRNKRRRRRKAFDKRFRKYKQMSR